MSVVLLVTAIATLVAAVTCLCISAGVALGVVLLVKLWLWLLRQVREAIKAVGRRLTRSWRRHAKSQEVLF